MIEPTIPRSRIDEVDAKYRSPKERAEDVWAVFQLAARELGYEYTHYDLVCFTCQFLGSLALGQFAQNQAFVDLAMEVNKWINSIHYAEAEKILGEEGDRK